MVKVTPKMKSSGELDCARIKLNDVLAHISRGENGHEDEYYVDDHTESSLSPQHKAKRARGPRKKRIRDDGYMKSSSFVLKLFDRSVDLAQFSYTTANENSSLYPVCRAWIKNQAHPASVDETMLPVECNEASLDEDMVEDKPSGITILPTPIGIPKGENGAVVDLRVPSNVQKPSLSSEEIDDAIKSAEGEDVNALLERNLSHWKWVRTQWKKAAQQNEARYRHSCSVLKAMYERSLSAQDDVEHLNKPIASPSE